jgi:pantothenate kinase type III
MNKIILDVGNTNIKMGIIENNIISDIKIYPNIEIEKFLFMDIFFNKYIYISSNNKKILKKIIKFLKDNNIDYFLFENIFFKNKININEEIDIFELGIDILIYLYFFKRNNFKNHLGFSFGTSNFCLIYESELKGVIIMPGKQLIINSIIDNTDIKNIELKENMNLPINTSQSISNGLFHILYGSINSIIEEYKFDKVYLTGGDINFIKNDKINSNQIIIIKEIVLKTILDIINDFNL